MSGRGRAFELSKFVIMLINAAAQRPRAEMFKIVRNSSPDKNLLNLLNEINLFLISPPHKQPHF